MKFHQEIIIFSRYVAKGLECFYCNTEECSDDHPGEIVKCQQSDPSGDHYGRTCAIGHSSKIT